jgi:hypothetical protein
MNLNDLACSFIGTVLLMAICFEKEEQTDEEKPGFSLLIRKSQNTRRSISRALRTPGTSTRYWKFLKSKGL